ncbi:phytanoyl-CoA dioxygenase family protein [Sphingomonas sp. LaA6.9]|uniref:phytanoyl-CoA dioxygenase family protein n=1 Tax=Sphingomonas sp. LaA6.9 TaxID=2919914 RepID=UPI001F4FBA80|nr:phytanoyl-CoA dioxygenase family protein [Sphingomonas sp. LaA6.9]MCJ8159172.1 phytanoyl-CoA dioxygenase family protein [Sphingomonas sp. LaA6.9]
MPFEDQTRQFAEQGYAVFPGALAGAALDLLRTECDAFVAREDARMDALGVDTLGISHRGKRYFANECQRVAPQLRTVLFSPAMADICRATLGDDAYFFFDQYVVKGPEGGMPFSWHQDSGYVVGNGGPADHAPYLTCWCPLDDATEENGTVRLIPGSHKHGILPHERQPGTNDLAGAPAETEGQIVEARAGDVVVFSSLTLHATGANRTDRPRRVYLAQYTPEAMLDPGTRHLRRNAIPILRHGERVTTG